MADLPNHTQYLWCGIVFNNLVHFSQAQCLQCPLLARWPIDSTSYLFYSYPVHNLWIISLTIKNLLNINLPDLSYSMGITQLCKSINSCLDNTVRIG